MKNLQSVGNIHTAMLTADLQLRGLKKYATHDHHKIVIKPAIKARFFINFY